MNDIVNDENTDENPRKRLKLDAQPPSVDKIFLAKIVSALDNTNNPNNSERKKAEKLLMKAKNIVGYASALLSISTDQTC